MKNLGTIRAGDVFPGTIDSPDESYPAIRKTVRLVLEDKEGRFGFLMYPKRPGFPEDYCGFLGGGVESGETLLEALVREAREEVGCTIKDIRELGMIKEFGVDGSNQATEAYCYFARVDGPKGVPEPDEKEHAAGARPVWLTIPEAWAMYEKQPSGFSKHRAEILFEVLKHEA